MAWKPIETAPRDGTAVLLYCPTIESWLRPDVLPNIVVGWYGRDLDDDPEGWYSDIGTMETVYRSEAPYFVRELLNPTHWMALPPELPSEGSNVER
jgi:hypothetical protein